MMGLSAKLGNKRGKKSPTIQLPSVLEIKIIICDRCQSGRTYGFDVLYDRRTGHLYKLHQQRLAEMSPTKERSCRIPLRKLNHRSSAVRDREL
jgi:hypothetical protein